MTREMRIVRVRDFLNAVEPPQTDEEREEAGEIAASLIDAVDAILDPLVRAIKESGGER